jgi:hypothetical protein
LPGIILRLWQMMKRTTMSKRTWTMCISLKKKINYYHFFDTLTHPVWDGLVLVKNDIEALSDDEEDHNEKENLNHVHLS